MAAAVIPIVISAVSALLPMVPNIVQAVELMFGPKAGPDKMKVATGMLKVAADQMSTAGKIDGLVDESTLATLTQTIVSQMIVAGQLPSSSAVKIPASSFPVSAPVGLLASIGPGGMRVLFTGVLIPND